MSQFKTLGIGLVIYTYLLTRGSKAESFPTDQTDNRGAEG